MIEIAKLQQMVQAEVAADKWWTALTKKEQQAYVKAHPKSKFRLSQTNKPTPTLEANPARGMEATSGCVSPLIHA